MIEYVYTEVCDGMYIMQYHCNVMMSCLATPGDELGKEGA